MRYGGCALRFIRPGYSEQFLHFYEAIRLLRLSQSVSGEAQLYLLHVTLRVPRSVHAKFDAVWSKLCVLEGHIHTGRQTYCPPFVIQKLIYMHTISA